MIRGSIYEEDIQVKRYSLEKKGKKNNPRYRGEAGLMSPQTQYTCMDVQYMGMQVQDTRKRMSLNECYINWVIRN